MNQVRFDGENEFQLRSRKLLGEPETPVMARYLLRLGLVKNEKQALFVLMGIVVIALAMTIFLMRSNTNSGAGIVELPDGTTYTTEEYFKLVGEGNDPMERNF